MCAHESIGLIKVVGRGGFVLVDHVDLLITLLLSRRSWPPATCSIGHRASPVKSRCTASQTLSVDQQAPDPCQCPLDKLPNM